MVIVNGDADTLGELLPVLPPGPCDVHFAQSRDRAFSLIRRLLPDLVVVCLPAWDAAEAHLMTMLALAPETSGIKLVPWVTCAEGVSGEPPVPAPYEEEGLPFPARITGRAN